MTLPDHVLCRSSYYEDMGRRRAPGEREVRCGRGDGHLGDLHAELDADGAVVAEWLRRPREPRTWSLPAEPGPEVKAVRDCDGQVWRRDPGVWFIGKRGAGGTALPWGDLLRFGPLTEEPDPDA